jgi:hypothetical protein
VENTGSSLYSVGRGERQGKIRNSRTQERKWGNESVAPPRDGQGPSMDLKIGEEWISGHNIPILSRQA